MTTITAAAPTTEMWWVVALGIVFFGTREDATSKHLRNGFDRTTLLGPFASEAEAQAHRMY